MPAPTMVLATTAAGLLAAEIPFPVELSALALVGFILRWLVVRENRADDSMLKRIEHLERDLAAMTVAQSEERRLKHAALNDAASRGMAVHLMAAAARHCTCGQMDQILYLVESTGVVPDPKG